MRFGFFFPRCSKSTCASLAGFRSQFARKLHSCAPLVHWRALVLLVTTPLALEILPAAHGQVVFNGTSSVLISGSSNLSLSFGQAFYPDGIAVDAKGDLFINNDQNSSLTKWTRSGGIYYGQPLFYTVGVGIYGIGADSSGNIFHGQNGLEPK